MKKFLIILFLPLIISSCCKPTKEETAKNDVIGQQNIKLENDLMTPESMWAMGRVSEIQISPGDSLILFGVTWYDWKQNKGNRDLYVMRPDGSNRKNITNSAAGEYNAVWNNKGEILFMAANDKGEMQIYKMKSDGSSKSVVSDEPGGISGFLLSPDDKHIAFIKDLPLPTVQDIYKDLDKANARIIDDLMFRHWDEWTTTQSHLFIAPLADGKMGKGTDLLDGEPYEVPQKPFGGLEQICWAPDGESIVYTCRKKPELIMHYLQTPICICMTLLQGKQKHRWDGGI